jgi:molybdate transport system substrate-binding protein
MPMHCIGKRLFPVLLLSLSLALGACGSDDGDAPLTVSAAASLTEAFEAYAEALPGEQRFSFAGSDQLAAQIRQGARPDVFAAADTELPEQLAAEGLVDEPVVFARNELAIAVAPDSPIDSIDDLGAAGTDLVVCAEGVPCGDYTAAVLGRLPGAAREAIEANVRAEESDVKGVLAKVAQGAADAGFVYASDAAAAGTDVRTVEIPRALEPTVAYAIAVVEGAAEPAAAGEFIDGVLDGAGAAALAEAGFLAPR